MGPALRELLERTARTLEEHTCDEYYLESAGKDLERLAAELRTALLVDEDVSRLEAAFEALEAPGSILDPDGVCPHYDDGEHIYGGSTDGRCACGYGGDEARCIHSNIGPLGICKLCGVEVEGWSLEKGAP